VDRTALEAHLTKDLARLYRFAPGQGVTRRLDWAEAWPRLALSSVPMPAGNTGVRPEGGVMLVGQGHQAWLLPLSNLPWTEVRPAPVKP
jgi:hypothetical protein